jgi:uncharacterized membrane protein
VFELLFKYSRTTFERSEFLFASGWPIWLLVLLVIGAAAAVTVSLARRRGLLGAGKLAVIGVLQTLMIAIVLVLVWQPALLTQTLRPQENAVAVLLDTSASMGYSEAAGGESRLQQSVAVMEARVLPELERQFDLELFAFSGDAIAMTSLEEIPPPGAVTHIGDALLGVLRAAQSGALGALILVSDGADNSGRLDAASIAEIASFGVPVHTVGVGREVIPEDIELENVVIAPQVLPGSTISAQVSIRHARAAQANLRVYDGDAILAARTIDLPNRVGVTTRWIDIDVGEPGIKDLRFSLDPLPGERNLINNTRFRPLEVPPARRTVLYVEGEPRWEYKFMRRALTEGSAIRLATLLRTTPNKFYRQGIESADELEAGFPSDEETLFGYDALIIGSFEAAALTPAQQRMIRDFVSRRGGSLLMLAGLRGLTDGGWGASPVADVLPVLMPEPEAPTFHRIPARASLTPEGARSLITRLDVDDAVNAALWREMPNIADFQDLGDLKPGAIALLEAQPQGRNTTQPLFAHQRFGLGNAYVLATGGTWRWQMQLPHTDERHETFWRQLMQALVTPSPRPVTLTSDRVFYGDDSVIELRAEVRDGSFQPAETAAVSVAVDTGIGPATTIEMRPVAGERGVFAAVYDPPGSGVFRFEATAEQDGTALGSARHAVRRESGVSEHFQFEQNRPLLERVANATGGRYFTLADVGALPEAVRFSDAGVVERQLLDLWNVPFAFLMLLLLKGGEWILRLLWGRL